MAPRIIECVACGQVMRRGSAFCPQCRHVVGEPFGAVATAPEPAKAPHEQEYPTWVEAAAGLGQLIENLGSSYLRWATRTAGTNTDMFYDDDNDSSDGSDDCSD